MAYQTSMIKDLSIALDALSKVHNVETEFERVRDLLRDAINRQEIDNSKVYKEERTASQAKLDDNIPF